MKKIFLIVTFIYFFLINNIANAQLKVFSGGNVSVGNLIGIPIAKITLEKEFFNFIIPQLKLLLMIQLIIPLL
jgi:hypothetical protein